MTTATRLKNIYQDMDMLHDECDLEATHVDKMECQSVYTYHFEDDSTLTIYNDYDIVCN